MPNPHTTQTGKPKKDLRLTTGPIGRRLIKMSLPMMGGVFSVIAFNLADTYFISQLGTLPLAAMGFTFPVTMILGSIAMGLGTGASSVVSRLIGESQHNEDAASEGEPDVSPCTEVQTVTTHTMVLATVIAITFSVLGLFTINPVFQALGADGSTLPFIQAYMVWWYIGIIFLIAPMVANSIIRATGDTTTPSIIMLIVAVANIVLDPLLIFGLYGFPEWGLAGAAIATIFSRALTMAASAWILHQRLHMVRIRALAVPFSEYLHSFKRVFAIGIPAIGTNMILPVGAAIITRMISGYGETAVASFGVVSKLEAFAFIPIIALATSLSAVVGQNYGAKQYPRVFEALWKSSAFSIVYGLLIATAMLYFGKTMIGWFDSTPAVVEAGYLFLLWVGWSYGLEGIIWMVNTSFNAMGKPKFPIIFATLRVVVIYLPLGYVLNQLMGMGGIYAAIGLANLIVAGIGLLCMRRQQLQCQQQSTLIPPQEV